MAITWSAQIAALAFLAKAVGEANGNEKAKAFDLVHELSLVAQSIESTLSEKEVIDEKEIGRASCRERVLRLV